MTPAELVAVIADADEHLPRGSRRIILEVHSARLLGFKGRPLGRDHGGPVYGYTRKQAHAIAAMIVAATEAEVR